MVESTEMGAETARIDNILDQLAHGAVYAEYASIATYADDIKEVTDAASSYIADPSGQRRHIAGMGSQFHNRRYRDALYIPKMEMADKMITLTVLGLLACFGIFAALAAYSMLGLTENIRIRYADHGPIIEDQPVPMQILLSDSLFEQRLIEFPDQVVALYIKRTKALRGKKMWSRAVRAFELALLHSVHPIAMDMHLDHIDNLVQAGSIERAMIHLESLHREAMSDRERRSATAILGRLHFALQP